MHVKRKSIFFLTTILATLILSLTAFPPVTINVGTQVQNPINDNDKGVVPKTAGDITKIEFVQAGGYSFDYINQPNQRYFKTGNGSFTLRLHLSAALTNTQSIDIGLRAFDPSYHAILNLDSAMMDELPIPLAIVMTIGLPSLSVPLLYTITSNTPHVTEGSDTVYELTIPSTAEYQFSPTLFISGFDFSFLLPLLGLISPSFQLDQFEYIQNIKYGIINQFTITGNGITGFTNYDNINVPNEDHSAPDYTRPEWNQENTANDWGIKIKIFDEFEGSGTDNEDAYIWYSVNGGAWVKKSDPLLLGDDGYLHGSIPNQLAGSEIKFYIEYSDRAGNTATTQTYTFWANPLEIQPVAILLIGIGIVTVATIAATRIYRNRHQPRVITLPTKKKVDKYYKKLQKEGGSI